MSMSEMGEEPVGEESGREPAGRPEGQARRRWAAVRRVAGRVAVALAVEVVRAVVTAWVPELPDVTPLLEAAVQFVLRLRRGRGGRPRG
ncbi:hypothetical protein Slala03_82180 [Streptomyces lavendulae subsp. lavendulae]|uniref:hypothetical protein n=1 Tax=Streptomyces lavendulae TaxID=1914 RepID=UPI0024A5D70F|nr:hypothetical protein [Streptomyces lavendulae]GLV88529.1 hypothetical protein Slala03_82180 [Streptomyces lavendulae subsp. lavendulae]